MNMDWPSARVSPGGIFHPHKVTYSPETKKFLQELMQESKLSMMQRNKINYSLRSGDPLPLLSQISAKPVKKTPEIVVRPGTNTTRRKLSSIMESGAYEAERYIPKQKGVDREFAKRHLQDFMAYGKEMKNIPKPKKKTTDEDKEITNRFDEIKKEIQERVEWLEDMEKLGEGHKYKILIEQQIAARIREMKNLKPAISN